MKDLSMFDYFMHNWHSKKDIKEHFSRNKRSLCVAHFEDGILILKECQFCPEIHSDTYLPLCITFPVGK